ncbi:MAG TPA: hypothetical protein VMF06_01295, partial [Candidatus Limnocylindria bacterium]|nr:hypothetical protein [Candidatus Limnocylindria bacterium]
MLLVAFGSFATASTVADAMVFDLSHDFSVGTNPTVTWTYGYKTNLAGPVVPFATHKVSPDDHGLMIASWSKNGLDPSDIIFNQTTSIAISDGGAGVFEPGTVIVHAGLDGNLDNFGAVRFTVPAGASGIYDLATHVRTYLDGAKSHDA